jgi:hypothetical protein
MSMMDIVVNIANRQVKRIILILSCGDGHSSFVAAKNYWYEHCPVSVSVLGNRISLLPSPVTTHEVLPMPPLLGVELLEWNVIELTIEVLVCEQVVDKFLGVVVPNIIGFCHPQWDNAILGKGAIITD